MDRYELQRLEDQMRDAEARHRRELDNLKYEHDRALEDVSRAQQSAEQAREYTRNLRREYESEQEQYAEELAERVAEVKHLKAEQKLMLTVLRRLATANQPATAQRDFEAWQAEFKVALSEANELLKLIDLAKRDG